jgi:hypothetical protein
MMGEAKGTKKSMSSGFLSFNVSMYTRSLNAIILRYGLDTILDMLLKGFLIREEIGVTGG